VIAMNSARFGLGKTFTRATWLAGLASCGLLTASCQPKADDAADVRAPPPKVNLPPSPAMVEPKFVEKYADGSFTVSGLVRARTRQLGKPARVKGTVQSVTRCADPEVPCTPPPHAILVDDPTRPRERLLVVGASDTLFPTLQQGQSPILEGDYLEADPSGTFVRMEGVLVLHPAPTEGGAAAPAEGVAPVAAPAEAPAAPAEAPAAPAEAPAAPAP
jgi:hypothetical protein